MPLPANYNYAIDTAINMLLKNSKPQAATFGSTTTDAVVTNFTVLTANPATKVEVWNQTGKTLVFDRGLGTPTFELPAGLTKIFSVVANSNELRVASKTAGAVTFFWEAVL